MAKLTDPDSLNQATEVVISTAGKTIQLLEAGNLNNNSPGATSGVTGQALYSFLKEEWKTDTALNKFKFPLKMYTKTDGTFINGWTFADATSRTLVRDFGWTEGSNEYACIVSLGNFDDDLDQGYYSHIIGYDQTKIDFDKTGNLNESILITTFEGYLKLFLRIASGTGTGKIYSEYDLLTEQSIALLEPVLYKLPLANSDDLKINTTDAVIDGATDPWQLMKINYLAGSGFTTWANSTPYAAGAVVQSIAGRWYFTALGGTSSGTDVLDDIGVADWAAYDGEVQIGAGYYAFNRLLTGGNGAHQQIYNWAQRQLRKATDINAGDSPTVNQRRGDVHYGDVSELLLYYIGDTLHTMPGLYIAGFHTDSTNSIKFHDVTVDEGGVDADTYLPLVSTERAYPYVATGTLEFSSNLVAEPDGDTWFAMYFTDAGGNLFDSANAIIVDDNSTTDISGQITGASMSWDFDYDNNVQGGRTAGTDAAVSIVAQGLDGATWVLATYTITRASGQSINVNADDERNYDNPV